VLPTATKRIIVLELAENVYRGVVVDDDIPPPDSP
jgi:hypothetical protein